VVVVDLIKTANGVIFW